MIRASSLIGNRGLPPWNGDYFPKAGNLGYESGEYYKSTMPYNSVSYNTIVKESRMYVTPFRPTRNVTMTKICVYNSGQVNPANLKYTRLGVYEAIDKDSLKPSGVGLKMEQTAQVDFVGQAGWQVSLANPVDLLKNNLYYGAIAMSNYDGDVATLVNESREFASQGSIDVEQTTHLFGPFNVSYSVAFVYSTGIDLPADATGLTHYRQNWAPLFYYLVE